MVYVDSLHSFRQKFTGTKAHIDLFQRNITFRAVGLLKSLSLA